MIALPRHQVRNVHVPRETGRQVCTSQSTGCFGKKKLFTCSNASDDPEVDLCLDPDNFGKGAEAVWSELGTAVVDRRDMSKVWS